MIFTPLTFIILFLYGVIAFFLGTKTGLNSARKIFKTDADYYIKMRKISELKTTELRLAIRAMKSQQDAINCLLQKATQEREFGCMPQININKEKNEDSASTQNNFSRS